MIVAIAVISGACGHKPPDDRDYVTLLTTDRESKNAQFLKKNDPVPKSRKTDLLPLTFFPIDPEYNVPAALRPAAEEKIVQMATSTGAPRRQLIVGTLEFVLKGHSYKLLSSVDADAVNLDYITVMFSDLTSGTETYPGGRYIDLDRNAQGIYQLDFNRAYNPYCYYNASYECPYPPRENRLPVSIRAGEQVRSAENR